MRSVLHILLLLALPPLMLGVIARTKALAAGRRGAPMLQPYFDLARLLRKGMVLSELTTWRFLAGPLVSLAALVTAGLMVPIGGLEAPARFAGDLLPVVALLALARLFTTTAALDTGSSFEGMGATRELTFACLAEAALMIGLLALVKFSGSLSLTTMLHAPIDRSWGGATAPLLLIAGGLAIVLVTETGRIPVDDPTTHAELTMIHEVMALDHSGPLLAAVHYGAAMKLLLLGAVLTPLLLPVAGDGPVMRSAIAVAALLGLSVAIGVLESIMARLQMRHVPQLLAGACVLCGLGLLLLVR